MRRLVTFLVVLSSTLGVGLHGAQPVQAASDLYFTRFYPQTNHNLFLPFLKYWDDMGGLPVFGYPTSEALMERNTDLGNYFVTQYFERNRFELHPENSWPYRVLLGRLGVEALQQQGRHWESFPKANSDAPHYVAATGHAIASQFWDYYRMHGLDLGDPGVSDRESLALFGYPVSEAVMETNSSGDTVLTQWFERARFEYHPNNAEPYKVLLGLLANDLTHDRRGEADFQPKAELDITHAAAHRQALAEAEPLNRAIPYRDDLQALADQYSSDGQTPQLRAALIEHPPAADVILWTSQQNLTAKCPRDSSNQPIDPNDPLGSALTAGMEPSILQGMSQITIGVSSLRTTYCGPGISMIVISTYGH